MLNRIRINICGSITLAALFLTLFSASPVRAVEIGAEPPALTLSDLAGETVQLDDYRGRLIILKFATTWCSGCIRQVKEFAKIETFLVDNDIVLIEVFVDQEPEGAVRDYLQQRDFSLPSITLLDDGSAVRTYRLLGLPWVLLIDRDFKVVRERGLISGADLQKQLQMLLHR
jgi:peroxiredoxin